MATSNGDILTRLRSDHQSVKELLAKLEKTTERGASTRSRLVEKIAREIEAHSTAEEETLYRRFRDAAQETSEEEMVYEAREEHHVVDLVLPELRGTDPTSPVFAAKAKVLKELVEHHIKEEEREMFKKARQNFSRDELREMGETFGRRKRELMR